MFDLRLRATKDRLARPVAQRLSPHVTPMVLTAASLVAGGAAAVAAGMGAGWWSLALWWLNRVLDGLDGAVARAGGSTTDLGGYLDQLGDTVTYALIPLGVAAASGDDATWVATGVLLATFSVNTVSWLYLSAVLEKRGLGRASGTAATSVVMPTGLVEGAETVVLYSFLLAFPGSAPWWCTLMAGLVALTVLQRVWWARRWLSGGP